MKENLKINLEQPIGRVLSQVGRNYLAALNLRLTHVDIERNYYALLVIDQYDGSLTQQQLANLLNTDKVSVVRIIDYLSDKGYVMRVKNAIDRRKYAITITKKAKSQIENIQKSMQENTSCAFNGLSESEIFTFKQTLNIINENLKHSISELCKYTSTI